MAVRQTPDAAGGTTSIDKALGVCEVLSAHVEGLSLAELARALELPAPTVHRLLAVLKRRGYVRQDEDTSWYRLTLKVLDLGFRQLGRSELKLHAYPLLREYALRTGARCFVAAPPPARSRMCGARGRTRWRCTPPMARRCRGIVRCTLMRFQATRRLSCLRLVTPGDVENASAQVVRLGPTECQDGGQRLICTCAPVRDYTEREVARVGVFAHAANETAILTEHNRGAWELARLISMRLGHLPGASGGVTA